MSLRKARIVNYMNGTGYVQGLRLRLRACLPPHDAVEAERMLDGVIERTIELVDMEYQPRSQVVARAVGKKKAIRK